MVDAEFVGGVYETFRGNEPGSYSGQVNTAGERHGQGVMRYRFGDKYEGEWRHDRFDGRGVYTHDNGDVYEGQWKDGRQHGFGTMSYDEGDYNYTGHWARGRYAGQGAMRQNGEIVAEGDWSTGTWTKGGWDLPYPRAGAQGTKVTARKSSGPPAPRKQLALKPKSRMCPPGPNHPLVAANHPAPPK